MTPESQRQQDTVPFDTPELRDLLHELRSPLTAIVGAAALIQMTDDVGRAHRLAADVAEAAATLDARLSSAFKMISDS